MSGCATNVLISLESPISRRYELTTGIEVLNRWEAVRHSELAIYERLEFLHALLQR